MKQWRQASALVSVFLALGAQTVQGKLAVDEPRGFFLGPYQPSQAGVVRNAKGTIISSVSSSENEGNPLADWQNASPQMKGTGEGESFEGVQSNRAYNKFGIPTGQAIVVAVMDGGVDVTHPDLRGKLWVNQKEVPNDGLDNDGNGYVDDIFGWNFIGNSAGQAQFYPLNGTSFDSGVRYVAGDRKYQVTGDTLEVTRELVRLKKLQSTRELTPEEKNDLSEVNTQYLAMQLAGYPKYMFDLNSDTRATIVKDNYSDYTERFYGNNDVIATTPFHGTHVSGIIAAKRDGVGIDGVATNVQIMAIRVVPDGDERDKDVANGIRYAVDNGAKVINMSFGKGFPSYQGKALVDRAVKYAASKGVIFVHAAGNDTQDNDANRNFPNRWNKLEYPNEQKAFPLWIEVGASTYNKDSVSDEKDIFGDEPVPFKNRLAAPFSNYGKKSVDVFAPGFRIYSLAPRNQYQEASGTSMAAPVTSGVIAAALAYFPRKCPKLIRDTVVGQSRTFPGVNTILGYENEGPLVPFNSLSISGGVVDLFKTVSYLRSYQPRCN